jgi:hypothetical protein
MADIRINANELNDPAIDEVVNLQKSLARSGGEFIDDIPTPFYLNPIFYYSVVAMVLAAGVWAAEEPFLNELEEEGHGFGAIPFVSDFMLFGAVAGIIGLAVGLAYGLANRNLRQTFYCSTVGIGVGLGATLATTFIAEKIMLVGLIGAVSASGQGMEFQGEFRPHGLAFFILMCTRGLAWAVVSLSAGLGLGLALKSKKLLINGLAGGLIGGMLGGLLFDPVHRFILDYGPTAWLSRGIGISAIGLLVGFFIGLFENISKDAWFLMLRGPLSGKQFVIFKSPLVIGSAPKSDIYLFKDPAIEPRHATVTKSGAKYILQDAGTPEGTFVNGQKIDRYILQPDDVVSIGETVLKYHEKMKH